MSRQQACLHFISGKIGSGKTTLATTLAVDNNIIFISEDRWLETLYPNMIENLQDYLTYSAYLRQAIADHVIELLNKPEF